jgi:four helix bundle protein
MSQKQGIDERSQEFSAAAIRFVRTIRPEPAARNVIEQLAAAAGSIAANRQEATGASSRREFIRYNEIALRSAKESVSWLRTCQDTEMGDAALCAELLGECRQMVRILAAIVVTTKANKKPQTLDL